MKLSTLFCKNNHFRFIARTVMVDNSPEVDNGIEKAVQLMESKLTSEGIMQQWKRDRYYEKPWMARRRRAYEATKLIYDKEMNVKMEFLMRTNRNNPWRC